MINELLELLYSFQPVRQLIGGTWWLVADYRRDKTVWMLDQPEGYNILDHEEWV